MTGTNEHGAFPERCELDKLIASAAGKGDRHGNLVFHSSPAISTRCPMAGQITIAEAEHLFDAGELAPDEIHLPGVFVHRLIALTPDQTTDKRVKKTYRPPRALVGRRAFRRKDRRLTHGPDP